MFIIRFAAGSPPLRDAVLRRVVDTGEPFWAVEHGDETVLLVRVANGNGEALRRSLAPLAGVATWPPSTPPTPCPRAPPSPAPPR